MSPSRKGTAQFERFRGKESVRIVAGRDEWSAGSILIKLGVGRAPQTIPCQQGHRF